MTTHSYPALTEIVLPWGFSLYNRITDFDLRYRGYYMAARRYEISLLVLKNISRVSAANEWNIFFNTRREISYLQATINTVTLKIKVHLSPLVTIIPLSYHSALFSFFCYLTNALFSLTSWICPKFSLRSCKMDLWRAKLCSNTFWEGQGGGGSFGRLVFERFLVPSCDREKGWENKKKSVQLSKDGTQFL